MNLLSIASIKTQLDERFLPLEPMLTGLRLIPTGEQEIRIAACERALDVTFPKDFAALVSRFDFGQLTIGPVAFCNTGDYFECLLQSNQDGEQQQFPWWPGKNRPKGMLLLSVTDEYAVLLDCKSGKVFAFDCGTGLPKEIFPIADNFECFFRAVGTAMLERSTDGNNNRLANDIAKAAGVNSDNPFWLWLAH